MEYLKLSLHTSDPETRSILVAELSELGFEGFEEEKECLHAYVPANGFDETWLPHALPGDIPFSTEIIPPQNWNAQWESEFRPVVIEGFCTVRSSFHDMEVRTPYEIIITPKMSFGTGHHATTQLMIRLMQEIPFDGKSVLDFGTGTGILAILAEKLGAQHVAAVDNDEWAINNARENAAANLCSRIRLYAGTIGDIDDEQFDIVAANINRNVLLQYMPVISHRLAAAGYLLVSGILKEDVAAINDAALQNDLVFCKCLEQENWMAILYRSGK